MKKWNLIVDIAECTNCNLCTLALQDEHVDNDFPGYAAAMPKHGHRWINIERHERGTPPVTDVAYLPVMCQHCDDAPCIRAAPEAVHKREDGIVIIDPEKSRGRRDLVDSCPYGAIWWNEAKQIPQHWIFDAHLLDQGWDEPRCVTVCATNALKAVKLEDSEMQQLAEREQLQALRSDLDTKPRVHYKNLWRYNSCFIAGTVSGEVDGRIECIENAGIELLVADKLISKQKSDNYGDFKLDKLSQTPADYVVLINAIGFYPRRLETSIDASTASINLGEIRLDALQT